MPYQIGSATDDRDLLQQLRFFLLGYGTAAAPVAGANTGTGTVSNVATHPATVTETITLSCTAAAANGGTFSVSGSVSGALGSATVGTPFTSAVIDLLINDGATDFIVGDSFTIATTQGAMSAAGSAWTAQRWIGHDQIVASSQLGNPNEAFRAVDGDLTTDWYTAQNQALPCTYALHFVSAVQPGAIAITAPGTYQRTPYTFTLEYSDDGAAWTVAQTFTAIAFTAAGQRQQLAVTATPGAHAWWRLNVSANNGDASYTGMREFEVLEAKGVYWLNHAVGAQLIMMAPGLAGTDQIYTGLQSYNLPTTDVYNWRCAGFTGFVDSSSFKTQPGISPVLAIPLRRNAMRYWFAANGQRVAVALQVDTTYQTFYLGKMLPYGTPQQYPYPLVVAAPLSTDGYIRYSDTSASAPTLAYKGTRNNLRLRFVDGTWKTPDCWPWNMTTTSIPRDTGGSYPLLPVILNDSAPNVYGELDGVAFVPGFGNAVENTVTVGAVSWLVVQDVAKTGPKDYFALQLA